MKLVDLVGLHVESSSGVPLVLLREHDEPHRVLPIVIGSPEAASIAVALSGEPSPRPLTHDLMESLVESLDAEVEAVEVTDLRDGAFLAAISVSGPGGGRRLDTRPSDAIALAVRLGTPLFVSDDVLEEVGTVIPEAPDEEAIDEAVAEFREFLDELEPTDFAGVAGELEPPAAVDAPEEGDDGDEDGAAGTVGADDADGDDADADGTGEGDPHDADDADGDEPRR